MSVAVAAAAAKSLHPCPTLCDPIDSSSPGSPVPGILQARILEWVAISFSNAWKKVKVKSLSRVQLFATPWTAAYQAPPSMGFSRREYWSGLPLPSPLYGWVLFYCVYMPHLLCPFTSHFHALEKEMATHSSVLAWRIPGTGEPGELPSMGSHRVGHDWSDLAAAAAATIS